MSCPGAPGVAAARLPPGAERSLEQHQRVRPTGAAPGCIPRAEPLHGLLNRIVSPHSVATVPTSLPRGSCSAPRVHAAAAATSATNCVSATRAPARRLRSSVTPSARPPPLGSGRRSSRGALDGHAVGDSWPGAVSFGRSLTTMSPGASRLPGWFRSAADRWRPQGLGGLVGDDRLPPAPTGGWAARRRGER